MKKEVLKTVFYICLLIIPAVLFYGAFLMYTVNIPINDDYGAVLEFTNNYVSATSDKEVLVNILAQQNEHRIAYAKVWTVLSYEIYGRIDLNFLALVGNLSIIGIFTVMALAVRKVSKNLVYLLPLSVLLFNIAFWENMTFAMAALSNFTGVMFALISLYFMSVQELRVKHVALGTLFFTGAAFTVGSGMFLVPIVFVMLWYRKAYKYLAAYGIVALLVITVYFYNYNNPSVMMETLLHFKARAVLFFFAYLGNAFNYFEVFQSDLPESLGITTLLGLVFFGLYLYAAWKKYYLKNLFVFSVMTFVVITAGVCALSRSPVGLDLAVASRYRINGAVFAVALFIWFIETQKVGAKRLTFGVVLMSALYVGFISLPHYESLSYRKEMSQLGALYYQMGDYTKLNGFEHDRYNQALIKSRELGTYTLPSAKELEAVFPYSVATVMEYTIDSSEVGSNIDEITKVGDSYFIRGYIFRINHSAEGQKVYLGLKSEDGKVLFYSAGLQERYDLEPYFKQPGLKSAGFLARIKQGGLTKGRYKILLKALDPDGTEKTLETDKILEI
jgi:hypothetical protein